MGEEADGEASCASVGGGNACTLGGGGIHGSVLDHKDHKDKSSNSFLCFSSCSLCCCRLTSCCWCCCITKGTQSTVKPRVRHPLNTNITLLQTVCFVPRERKPLHFRLIEPAFTDTPSIWTLSMARTASKLTGFDCNTRSAAIEMAETIQINHLDQRAFILQLDPIFTVRRYWPIGKRRQQNLDTINPSSH